MSRRRQSRAGFCPGAQWHTHPGATAELRLPRARRPVERAVPGAVPKPSAGWFYCLMVLVKLEAVFVLEELPRCCLAAAFFG